MLELSNGDVKARSSYSVLLWHKNIGCDNQFVSYRFGDFTIISFHFSFLFLFRFGFAAVVFIWKFDNSFLNWLIECIFTGNQCFDISCIPKQPIWISSIWRGRYQILYTIVFLCVFRSKSDYPSRKKEKEIKISIDLVCLIIKWFTFLCVIVIAEQRRRSGY